jgi:hypothetical protein
MTTSSERHAMEEVGTRIGGIQFYRPTRLGYCILEASGQQVSAAQSNKRGDMCGIDRTGGDEILDGGGPFTQSKASLGHPEVKITPRAQW